MTSLRLPERRRLSAHPSVSSPPAPGVSLGLVVGAVLVVVGAMIGIQALHDNSFLTHLTTGRLMLDRGVIREDPYTWTSPGEPWVVQSWLASLVYAVVDQVSGGTGLRLLTAGLCGILAAMVWRLSRPANGLLVRVVAAGSALVVGAGFWTHRPLLFGLIGMAVVLLVLERQVGPWVLVPTFLLWIQLHGSFPLGLVLIGLVAVGSRLDRVPAAVPLRALKYAALGCVLGAAANPYGPKLVLFPLDMLGRNDVLAHVAEWQSPDFARLEGRLFAVVVILAVAALIRRPAWRRALPLAVFVLAALAARRNIPVAALVTVPVIAAGLPDLGGLRADDRGPAQRIALVAVVVAALVAATTALRAPDYELDGYPGAAVAWLESRGLLDEDVRLVHPDTVGNYLSFVSRGETPVFIDDRFELHPRDLLDDYLVLDGGRAGWDEVLERRGADAVLWRRNEPLVGLLERTDGWTVGYRDDDWAVVCRGPCRGVVDA